MSKRAKAKPAPRGAITELAIGAAYLLAAAAILQAIEIYAGATALLAAFLGLFVAELVAGRAGSRWDGGAPLSQKVMARSILAGAAVALLVVALVVALGVALKLATVARGTPSVALGLAAIRAAAVGARDELVYRAIPLTAAKKAGVPSWIAVAYAALAGAAPLVFADGVTPAAFALAASTGWLFAVLAVRRNLFTAAAAHGVWLFAAGPLTRGALLDVDWTGASLVTGARAAGTPAWLATAVAAATAAAIMSRSARGAARE